MNGLMIPKSPVRLRAESTTTGSSLAKLVLLLIVDEYGPGKFYDLAHLAAVAETTSAEVVSALTALLDSFRFLPGLGRVFALGFFELGGGIGALSGWKAGPLTMALAGFLLSWGGLSVHGQTLGAVAGTDIKCARHLAGRALCGLFAALFSFLFSYLI